MKLVEDAKQAWRWISVQAMALALAVQGAWEVLPPEMKASIPPQYVTWLTLALLVLGLAGRLVKQGEK
jgi:protein-S-isoprenylcysteine O-methyltransferase Ste14